MKKLWMCLLMLLLLQTSQAQKPTKKNDTELPPPNGKLIIVGGGSMPDTMYQLFAKSIGGKDQSVVVIPTATNDSAINAGAHLTRFKKEGFTNLTTVHARNKTAADAPELIHAIKNAKGIYFSGGDQSRIADAFLGTQAHDAMLALFKKGGIFMGTSAGATIMGTLLVGGDARKDLTKPFDFPLALNLLPNTAIDQHVLARNRQFDLIPVIEQHPHLLGIAIDESTAIVVDGQQFSVLGKSYVMVYDAKDWEAQKKQWGRVLKPFMMMAQPQRYDFVSRKILRN
jgi:cyanophycinase